MAPIDTFPEFHRVLQMDINSKIHGLILLVKGYSNYVITEKRYEYRFMVFLQMDSTGTTALAKEPVKFEIVHANSWWQIDCLWGVFVEHLRIFREPLDQMPLRMNDPDELTRHFVNWRLEHGI